MANEDVLASLAIDIGVDLSDLDSQLGAAVDQFGSAGTQMAAALNDVDLWAGMEGQFNQLHEALQQTQSDFQAAADAAQKTGDAFGEASQPLGLMSSALDKVYQEFTLQKQALADAQDNLNTVSHAYENGAASAGQLQEAAQKLQQAYQSLNGSTQQATEDTGGFSEGLMELAGALGLVMTIEKLVEMIKEVGTEAISAASETEQFTTAMGLLTGSAGTAEEMLSDLKTTALQIPVSFASLETATQKMQAFGVATAQIPDMLRAAADAAAATGNSFDTVTQALTRIQLSGQISARQLVQLGVSWQDLANTMGKSVSDAQALLKKGGQDAAADVAVLLQTVEAKFSGAAVAMGQTLAGQFQIMKNQLVLVMESLGDALLPAAKAMIAAFETDLVPAIQKAVDGFKALSSAVAPFAGGLLSSFTGSIAQTVTALGNLSQGVAFVIGKLTDFVPATNATKGVMSGLGDALTYVSQPWQLLPVIINETSTAIGHFIPSVENSSTAMDKWKGSTDGAIANLAEIKTLTLQNVDSQQSAAQSLADLTANYKQLQENLKTTKSLLDAAKSASDGGAQSLGLIRLAQDAYAKAQEAATGTQAALTKAISAHGATLDQLTDKYGKANNALQIATNTLAQAQAGYNAGTVSQNVLVAAQNQWIAALQKSDPLTKSYGATVAELTVKHAQAAMTVTAIAAALQLATAAYQRAQSTGIGLAQSTSTLVSLQQEYAKALDAFNPLAKLHVESLTQMSTAYDLTQEKIKAATQVLGLSKLGLDAARLSAGGLVEVVGPLGTSFLTVGQNVQSATTNVALAKTALDQAAASGGNTAKAMALYQQSLEQLNGALKLQQTASGSQVASAAQLDAQYNLLKADLQKATAIVQDLTAKQDGSAQSTYALTQAKAAQAKIEQALGIAMQATTASAKAQAQGLDDLNTKAQTNINTLQQAKQNLDAAKASYDGSALSIARLTLAIQAYQAAEQAATGVAQVHVQTIEELTGHENALQTALVAAKAALDAAKAGFDGGTASTAILNAAIKQFQDLINQAGGDVNDLTSDVDDLTSGLDGLTSAFDKAGAAASGFGGGAKGAATASSTANFGSGAQVIVQQMINGGNNVGQSIPGSLAWAIGNNTTATTDNTTAATASTAATTANTAATTSNFATLTQALTDAQASLVQVTADYEAGNATAQQYLAAVNSFIAAQNALGGMTAYNTTATAANTSATVDASTAVTSGTTATIDNTTATTDNTAATSSLVTQVNQMGQAIDALNASLPATPAFPGADATSASANPSENAYLYNNGYYPTLFPNGTPSAQFGTPASMPVFPDASLLDQLPGVEQTASATYVSMNQAFQAALQTFQSTAAPGPTPFNPFYQGGGGNTPYTLPSGMEYTFQPMNLPNYADAGLVSPTGVFGETSTAALPGPVAGTPGYLMQQGDMAGALALAAAENDTTAGAGYLHSSAFTSVSTNFGVLPTINSGISGIAADVANIRQMASSNATKAPQYTINVTVSAGVVAGSNGMQQLGQMVGQQVVASLKQAGLKPM